MKEIKQKIGKFLLNVIIKFDLCPGISSYSEMYEDLCALCTKNLDDHEIE